MAPRRTAKTGQETKETAKYPWTASPKADKDRLYIPRKQGGRGLMQSEEAYTAEITKLVEYVHSTEHPLIQIVRTHQHNTN